MSEREAAVIAEQISIMRAEMGGGSAPYLHSPLGDVCDFYTYLEDEHGIRRKVIPFEHAEENAARIMALWNATLGIPTADLSALSASRERERALRRALDMFIYGTELTILKFGTPGATLALETARAALAKTGGSDERIN